MTSKTKSSGRIGFPLRMPPQLKSRLDRAGKEDGVSVNDWLLDLIEEGLATRDAEVAASKRKAHLERCRDAKFEEIVLSLAGGDITGLKANALIRIEERAEAVIGKWRAHAATFHDAEPRSPIEILCRDYQRLEEEIEGARRLDTFGDEGLAGKYGYDPDDTVDGDEPEPDPGDDEIDDVPHDGE